MYRKEVNAQSPLRILQKSIHGGLGKGNLGVVMAPPGVGKTACLVQMGLDDLMRERDVVHVAVGQSVEHVSAWYDALFDDLVASTNLEDVGAVREMVAHRRAIKTFNDSASLTPQRLEEAVELFTRHMSLKPAALLLDGFDWSGPDVAASIKGFKALARKLGAELWMSASTPKGSFIPRGSKAVPLPAEGCAALIEVAFYLEPLGSHVVLRLVKDHGDAEPPDTHLELHPDTLRLVVEGEVAVSRKLPVESFTLLSGGAQGAEAGFGECAEKWGLQEVNYSFPGRGVAARTRGMVELSNEELELGRVSSAYLQAHMHRTYPQTPLFTKVLQSIWHQVNTAGEVFAVGQVLPDNTVKGGTGWAVELGRHWGKPVHVYDQEKRSWFTWENGQWIPSLPVICRERFAGAGTRFLNDDGKRAICELFERSFGAAGGMGR